jgi:hypothetical protein
MLVEHRGGLAVMFTDRAFTKEDICKKCKKETGEGVK